MVTPSKLKALTVLAIIIAAVAVGAYYYLTLPAPAPSAPQRFSLSVNPQEFPISPGWGRNVTVQIARMDGFNSDIYAGILGGPSYVYYTPVVIHASMTNATMLITTRQDAPIGPENLTVTGQASGSSDVSVPIGIRIIGVTNVTNPSGTAQVYDTTRVLDNATMRALVGFDNSTGNIQFSTVTPTLQALERGDVIVGPPGMSPFATSGFLRTVLKVEQTSGGVTLSTDQATILDMFRTAHIGGPQPSSVGTSGTFGQQSISLHPEINIPIIPSTSWSYSEDIGNGYNAGVTITLEAHAFYGLDMDQLVQDACYATAAAEGLIAGVVCIVGASFVGKVDLFAATVQGHEEADAWFKGPGGNVQWGPKDIIPNMFGPTIVPIYAPYVWMDIKSALEASLIGHLHPTDIEAHATFDFSFGPVYKSDKYANGGPTGWQLDTYANPTFTKSINLGFDPGDYLRGELGPRLDVDIDAFVISGSISCHVFLELKAGPNWPSGSPTITSPTDGSIIDLSTPSFLNPNLFAWTATASQPQGVQLSCIWMDDKLGQIGHSTQGGCNMDQQDISVDQIIASGTSGPHHIKVTATWTNLPQFELDAGVDLTEKFNVFFGAWNKPFGPQDLVSFPIWTGGGGSLTADSNFVTVKFVLPVPVLQITTPSPPVSCASGVACNSYSDAIIYAGQPFTAQGSATIQTTTGIEDLCQTAPGRIGWAVGGYYSSDMGGWIDGYNDPSTVGSGCSPQLTVPNSGPNTINIWLVNSAGTDLAYDNNGNPLYLSVSVNVQQAPATGAPHVTITDLGGQVFSAFGQPAPVNSVVHLSGTITGGTPPYSITWIMHSSDLGTPPSGGSYDITSATVTSPGPVSYGWDLTTGFCNNFPTWNYATDVTVTLSVGDSNGMYDTATTGQFEISCAHVPSSFPLSPTAWAIFLTTLLLLTAECTMAPLFKRMPRLRTERRFTLMGTS